VNMRIVYMGDEYIYNDIGIGRDPERVLSSIGGVNLETFGLQTEPDQFPY
jgi:hypothetical protein